MATILEESPQLFDSRLTGFVFTYFQKKKTPGIAKKVRPDRNFLYVRRRGARPAQDGIMFFPVSGR
jgi:hypothetical protein